MARNKVHILCFPATSQLIGCRKQTFHKSTGGKKGPRCTASLHDRPSAANTTQIASPVWLCAKFKYQNTSLLIPKTPFQCLVKEIAEDYQPDVRFQPSVLVVLQEAAEDYLVSVFEDSVQVAQHTHRETIQPRDMVLVLTVRGDSS
ncbi:histone H3.1t [Mycena olivaceomarginata]|nr:histone H3.1t [Mycena olivaceomarginata]